MKMVHESWSRFLPIPSLFGRGARTMEPKLKLRLADPDDPYPFPGLEATPRWQPRLVRDPVIQGVEDMLDEMDAKVKELSRLAQFEDDDDDRPTAA